MDRSYKGFRVAGNGNTVFDILPDGTIVIERYDTEAGQIERNAFGPKYKPLVDQLSGD
ncbi:hypothetical protein HY501_03015 [Candidatus Woesearchaeota archaeon]|nr:hypothetical protein [Candidatus Woesearchaeota archaeon]